MSNGGAEPSRRAQNPTLSAIASGRRRTVLAVLLDRESPVTVQALATTLAGAEHGGTVADVTPAAMRSLRTGLEHVHLPKLADADLVTHDRASGTVAAASHPALDDPRFRRLIALDADGLDAVLSALAHEHRRVVLTTLREERAPASPDALAQEVVCREFGASEPDPESVARIALSLQHAHLPKLDDAGLVEYDPEAGRVAYADHPTLEAVFRIVYEPDDHLVEKFDGFLSGLEESYREGSRNASDSAGWPHFWGDPHHG